MTEKRKTPPHKDVSEVLRKCAAQHGGISALGRKVGLKSNYLQYIIIKRYPVSAALVGRFYCTFGDEAITQALAQACKQE